MNYSDFKKRCEGIQVILATPFKDNNDLDEASLRHNVRYLLDNGIRIFTTMGTNSEFYAVTPEEHRLIVSAVVEEVQGTGALSIVGASSTSTKVAIELCHQAEKAGADAVMVTPPYYMPASPKEIIAHYRAISESTSLGIVLYYMPQVHHAQFDHAVLNELCELKNVVGIKWCELELHAFTSAVRHFGDKIYFISGYGEYLASYTYLIGVNAISSTMAGYAPKFSLGLHEAAMNKDWERVRDISLQTFTLLDFAERTGVGMSLTKEAMKIVGLPAGKLRPPASSPLSDEDRRELARILEDLGVLAGGLEAVSSNVAV